tara:strand:+ start:60653 stop:61240 length:588 start_codon:yes stop_codon:yes gene_type:complete
MKNFLQRLTTMVFGLLLLASMPNTTTAQHTVEVSGEFIFDNGIQQYGVYGLRLYLYFEDIDDTVGPELLFPTEDIEGKSYDLLDEDGSFAFDFYYSGDLSKYDSVVVLSSAQNAAAIIEEKHPKSEFKDLIDLQNSQVWNKEGKEITMKNLYPQELKQNEQPSQEYKEMAYKIAQKRMALSGYRMAEFLNEIFGK